MSKHTPEPWVLFEVGDRFKHQCPASSDKHSILTVASEDDMHFGAVYKDEDARRIVACVNAFAGIDIEHIECMPTDVKTLAQAFVQMTLQRDELLQALIHLHHNAKASGAEMGLALDVAKDAIAKVKGGAA